MKKFNFTLNQQTKKNLIKAIFIILILVILSSISVYSVLRWGFSKENIAYPKQDHSHFRLKYIFEGQEEDFGSPRYQTDYTKDICSGDLTTSPLHFHDNKTDYQHQHWAGMTGGQWLKFYGYNLIGGLDGYLGFELDKLPKIIPVPIHSISLPKPRPNNKFWIYTGIENTDGSWTITPKIWNDFINQDFETFFNKESQARKDMERYKVSNNFIPNTGTITAKAHSGVEHTSITEAEAHLMTEKEKTDTNNRNNINFTTSPKNTNAVSSLTNSNKTTIEIDPITGEELKSINNFLGDVVIFSQTEEPSTDQIQTRFKTMIKLDKSTCGG